MSKEKSTQKYAVRVISVTLISVLLAVCFVSCGGGGGGAPAAPLAVGGNGDNSGSGSGSGSGSRVLVQMNKVFPRTKNNSTHYL